MKMLKNINERNGNLSIISLFALEFQRSFECDTPLLLHLHVNWFGFYSAYIRGSSFFDKAKIFTLFSRKKK